MTATTDPPHLERRPHQGSATSSSVAGSAGAPARTVRLLTVIGTRPQFVKAAVIGRAIARRANDDRTAGPAIEERIVHTGQHHDDVMSRVFFDELGIAPPAHHLGIAGGSPADMVARMMQALAPVIEAEAPDAVLVHGDTNSTLAGGLAASMAGARIVHLEAGLRSFDATMAEERNRVVVDHLSDLLLAPTATAMRHLQREGLADRARWTGDVMLDALEHERPAAEAMAPALLAELGLEPGGFVLATVHRAETTDHPERLAGAMDGLQRLARRHPVVLPLHPRTRHALDRQGLLGAVSTDLKVIEPVGYQAMLALETAAGLVATDSGGVQREACFVGVPCLVLRDRTEWVELVEGDASVLVDVDPEAIDREGVRRFGGTTSGVRARHGAGRAGDLVLEAIARHFA